MSENEIVDQLKALIGKDVAIKLNDVSAAQFSKLTKVDFESGYYFGMVIDPDTHVEEGPFFRGRIDRVIEVSELESR